ncbi:MAG: hypothetical protein SGI86_04245 [Deltaproteobacteria bacterium]|nr:hypothetical protein [Deltaproteobacteria bacterium]
MNSILYKTFFGIAATLFLFGASGCSEETTYSYFTIKMSLDPALEPEFLARVGACGLVVTGSDEHQITVPCLGENGKVVESLGAADFSTSEISGQLQFILNVYDFNRKLVALGTSARYGIVPNGQTAASVEAKKIKPDDRADTLKAAPSDSGAP